jgi:hypothetical protein
MPSKAKWSLLFESLKMKRHITCNEWSVKTNYAYYKTSKKEEKAPNLVQQSTSQKCFEGELTIRTTTQCPPFLLREEMKKKKNLQLEKYKNLMFNEL